jgi:hypothetical protein
MKILGIDPGLRACGLALIEASDTGKVTVLDLDLFCTPPNDPLRTRLIELRADARDFLKAHKPAVVVAEIPTYPRDAASAAMLWAAHATVAAIAEEHGARWVEMTTANWRAALGLPKEPSNAPRAPKGVKLSAEEDKTLKREQARCGARAKARRKRSTKDLMLARFPGAPALLHGIAADLREHPLDALAIACAWVELATRKPAAPAQGDLAL